MPFYLEMSKNISQQRDIYEKVIFPFLEIFYGLTKYIYNKELSILENSIWVESALKIYVEVIDKFIYSLLNKTLVID